MALAFPHISSLLRFKNDGIDKLITINSIMELGEQNWFGDVDPNELHIIINHYNSDEHAKNLHQQLDQILTQEQPLRSFNLAKLFYRIIFNHNKYAAYDLHGTAASTNFDLNKQVDVIEQYDLVTNIGTAEHVFNQYQFFKNMHDLTRPGGLMIHSLPNQGCYDHGFYNYHPTFFFDLCEANEYNKLGVFYVDVESRPMTSDSIERMDYVKMAVAGKLKTNSAIIAFFQKPLSEKEFKAPMQGYYSNTLPEELADLWNKLPR